MIPVAVSCMPCCARTTQLLGISNGVTPGNTSIPVTLTVATATDIVFEF